MANEPNSVSESAQPLEHGWFSATEKTADMRERLHVAKFRFFLTTCASAVNFDFPPQSRCYKVSDLWRNGDESDSHGRPDDTGADSGAGFSQGRNGRASGTRLGYWDTGGADEPIVLLHPASGSALIWLYQQPVFARAGYRVIAYSRRNYYNSDLAPADNPGQHRRLQNLIEFLRLEKFHLVSSAAGGSVAADYALSHPERLLSLTVSSNNLAAAAGYIAEAAAKIRIKEWDDLARWFRELGPSYRAANPAGVQKWISSITSPRLERAPGKS